MYNEHFIYHLLEFQLSKISRTRYNVLIDDISAAEHSIFAGIFNIPNMLDNGSISIVHDKEGIASRVCSVVWVP